MESIKINALEIENVKRIRAVMMEPSPTGLTVIGGDNNQGKTSILDAIAWGLGGDRYKPSNPARDGSVIPPRIKITLSNGLIVERIGKNSNLKVTDPTGKKSGQQLLNSFVEELAIDLPRFLESTSKQKAETLLRIIGVGDELRRLELNETERYNQRRTMGQIADQKAKYAKELPFYPDAPSEPVSVTELLMRQQAILAKNGENQRKRLLEAELRREADTLKSQLEELERKLKEVNIRYTQTVHDLEIARKDIRDLQDESTAELEADIRNIETINEKVRANCERMKAEQDAEGYSRDYNKLTDEIEDIRQRKRDLLNGARLPLEGLSVEDGELTYHGKKWDGMSGSDQLKVATAIVRAINPKCGFVLIDKLEQMDLTTMREFGKWLQEQGLQAITTRVSTGDECSVIIEDGQVTRQPLPEIPAPTNNWKAGVF